MKTKTKSDNVVMCIKYRFGSWAKRHLIKLPNLNRVRWMEAVEKKLVGKIAHYYTKIGVCVIELNEDLKVDDKISIEGATTDVQLVVSSMQIEHQNMPNAKAGQSIGLKVPQKVREGDLVYKIS